MTHISLKIILNELEDIRAISRNLGNTLGMQIARAPYKESDYIYNLLSNRRSDITLKLRETQADVKEIIFERTTQTRTLRQSWISVATLRQSNRDSDLKEIIGPQDHLIQKTRTIYRSEDHPRLRIYHDHVEAADLHFLEFQLDASSDTENDHQLLTSILSDLGYGNFTQISDPYTVLALKNMLPDHPGIIEMHGRLPGSILKGISQMPLHTANQNKILFEKGTSFDHAYFIQQGQAHITGTNICLKPGQLVGEFGMLEGARSNTVEVSEDFQAYVLSVPLLRELMVMPHFAQKYMQWKIDQAAPQYRI